MRRFIPMLLHLRRLHHGPRIEEMMLGESIKIFIDLRQRTHLLLEPSFLGAAMLLGQTTNTGSAREAFAGVRAGRGSPTSLENSVAENFETTLLKRRQ